MVDVVEDLVATESDVVVDEAHVAVRAPLARAEIMQRVGSEAVVALSAGRAFLVGLADPTVAAIIDRYSNYRVDIYGRLIKIAQAFYQMGFGDDAQVARVGAHLRTVHTGLVVNGRSANDPDVWNWTLYALIESAMIGYERFVAPLNPAESDALYDEACARLDVMDMAQDLPPSYTEFRTYMRERAAGLTVTAAAIKHRDHFLTPPDPKLLSPFTWFWKNVSIWTLPPELSEQYGLFLSRRTEASLKALAAVSRRTNGHMPDGVREVGLRMFADPEREYGLYATRHNETLTAYDVAKQVLAPADGRRSFLGRLGARRAGVAAAGPR